MLLGPYWRSVISLRDVCRTAFTTWASKETSDNQLPSIKRGVVDCGHLGRPAVLFFPKTQRLDRMKASTSQLFSCPDGTTVAECSGVSGGSTRGRTGQPGKLRSAAGAMLTLPHQLGTSARRLHRLAAEGCHGS